MASYLPPTKSAEFIFYICLESQAAPGTFQANPTIAAGDFTVSTDGGSFSNLDTTPTVTPASGVQVKVTVSATEMAGDNILIAWQDAAGSQWYSGCALVQPAAQSFDTMDTNIDSILTDTGTSGVLLAADQAVDVTKISGDSTAADRLEALLDGTPGGAVVDDDDPDPTTTAFETDLTEATDDHYNGAFLLFYTGNLLGQSRLISDYDGTNKIVTVSTAFTEAPAAGDDFLILGRSE